MFHFSIWGSLELCLGAKPTKAPLPWRRDCPGNDVYTTTTAFCSS